jgi:hypothetical protein
VVSDGRKGAVKVIIRAAGFGPAVPGPRGYQDQSRSRACRWRTGGRSRPAAHRGLRKTRLDHAFIALALNLLPLNAYWNGNPLDRARTSHLARLELNLAA